ncbi:MAG: hypothetical protein KAK00_00570 [Nanoarchaeota archaeon]|nr:hypothetical protein [Nanoarchaeota archaeon]
MRTIICKAMLMIFLIVTLPMSIPIVLADPIVDPFNDEVCDESLDVCNDNLCQRCATDIKKLGNSWPGRLNNCVNDNSCRPISKSELNKKNQKASSITPPGDQCVSRTEKVSAIAEFADSGPGQLLEKISSTLFFLATLVNTVDFGLALLGRIIGHQGPVADTNCCVSVFGNVGLCQANYGAFIVNKIKQIGFPLNAIYSIATCECCSSPGEWDKIGGLLKLGGSGGMCPLGNLANLLPIEEGSGLDKAHISAFDNIFTAFGCMCPVAILFNLRKLKTIYQVYNCCTEEACKNGINTISCERQLDEALCMYYEGSLKKTLITVFTSIVAGYIFKMFEENIKTLLSSKYSSCIMAVFDLMQIPGRLQTLMGAYKWLTHSFDEPVCKDLGFADAKERIESGIASESAGVKYTMLDTNHDGRMDEISKGYETKKLSADEVKEINPKWEGKTVTEYSGYGEEYNEVKYYEVSDGKLLSKKTYYDNNIEINSNEFQKILDSFKPIRFTDMGVDLGNGKIKPYQFENKIEDSQEKIIAKIGDIELDATPQMVENKYKIKGVKKEGNIFYYEGNEIFFRENNIHTSNQNKIYKLITPNLILTNTGVDEYNIKDKKGNILTEKIEFRDIHVSDELSHMDLIYQEADPDIFLETKSVLWVDSTLNIQKSDLTNHKIKAYAWGGELVVVDLKESNSEFTSSIYSDSKLIREVEVNQGGINIDSFLKKQAQDEIKLRIVRKLEKESIWHIGFDDNGGLIMNELDFHDPINIISSIEFDQYGLITKHSEKVGDNQYKISYSEKIYIEIDNIMYTYDPEYGIFKSDDLGATYPAELLSDVKKQIKEDTKANQEKDTATTPSEISIKNAEKEKLLRAEAYKLTWQMFNFILEEWAFKAIDESCQQDWEASEPAAGPITTKAREPVIEEHPSPLDEWGGDEGEGGPGACMGLAVTAQLRVTNNEGSAIDYNHDVTYTIAPCELVSYTVYLKNDTLPDYTLDEGYVAGQDSVSDSITEILPNIYETVCVDVNEETFCFPGVIEVEAQEGEGEEGEGSPGGEQGGEEEDNGEGEGESGEEDNEEDTLSPTVTLNTPQDLSIITVTEITFNCAVADDSDIAKVTLYGNWTGSLEADEEDTSAINNVDYSFTKELSDNEDYTWNCEACDSSDNCAFAEANFALSIKLDSGEEAT